MTTENKKEEICIKNYFFFRSGRIRGVLFLPILEKVNKKFPFSDETFLPSGHYDRNGLLAHPRAHEGQTGGAG